MLITNFCLLLAGEMATNVYGGSISISGTMRAYSHQTVPLYQLQAQSGARSRDSMTSSGGGPM